MASREPGPLLGVPAWRPAHPGGGAARRHDAGGPVRRLQGDQECKSLRFYVCDFGSV